MLFENAITVNARELNEAVEFQYDLEEGTIDVAELFWPGEYMNDCFKRLYYGEQEDIEDVGHVWSEDEPIEDDDARYRCLVRDYLRYAVPSALDWVLVDVSW